MSAVEPLFMHYYTVIHPRMSRYKCKIHLRIIEDLLAMRREYKFGGRHESKKEIEFALRCGDVAVLLYVLTH